MRVLASCLALPLCALLAGCAGEHDALDKQVAELRAELGKLRAAHAALEERFDNAELARGTFRGPAAAGSAAPAAGPAAPKSDGDRPSLDVVHLEPEPDASDDPDSDAPRPVVRAVGNGGSVQGGARGKIAGGGPAQDDYDKAFDLYKSKSFDRAIEAFGAFLSKYPDNPAAEQVSFLRAECTAGKGEHRRAAELFEAVAASFPQGQRAADALLRAAQLYGKAGDKAAADAARKKLLSNYPATDAARKAAKLPSDKKKP
ncbi:MAG: tetratricopeptide repeat protein [Byssovorax sp.]